MAIAGSWMAAPIIWERMPRSANTDPPPSPLPEVLSRQAGVIHFTDPTFADLTCDWRS